MPCTLEKQFPGAWPDPLLTESPPTNSSSATMDQRPLPPSDSLEELHGPSPSCSVSGAATPPSKKPPALRIIVPPTEYCPFSTDLTLPITPLSLPTPVSSSCFTFSDAQEPVSRTVSAPPTPVPGLSPRSRHTAVSDIASPTSSQFLLMPPTHTENKTAVRVSPLATPAATDAPMHSGSSRAKSENPRPWEVSSSTWLSDLGGRTETDRIFRDNLLGITLVDTDSSPASTPALSPSAASPSSQLSSILAYNLPTSLARSPPSSTPVLSPHVHTMYSRLSSPGRLVLKPTGTDAFPSTLDSLQVWREGVMSGIPPSVEPRSPLFENAPDSRLGGLIPETPSIYPSLPSHLPPPTSRVSRSRALVRHAKTFGGRVKQLITRQSINKHCGSMDRGVSFRVVTSQDSENGSVILITAPPPPYDTHPPALVPHGPMEQECARSRTISEYSSAPQASTIELSATGVTEPGSGQGSSNRNALRRLSLAALSTIKRS